MWYRFKIVSLAKKKTLQTEGAQGTSALSSHCFTEGWPWGSLVGGAPGLVSRRGGLQCLCIYRQDGRKWGHLVDVIVRSPGGGGWERASRTQPLAVSCFPLGWLRPAEGAAFSATARAEGMNLQGRWVFISSVTFALTYLRSCGCMCGSRVRTPWKWLLDTSWSFLCPWELYEINLNRNFTSCAFPEPYPRFLQMPGGFVSHSG